MSVLKKISFQFPVISLLVCSAFFLSMQPLNTREYQIKAAFLFNFTQFVEWPAASFATDQSPLIIGVLGENPFGSFLEETVSGEKVNGHPLIVQYYKNIEDIKQCHILFINTSEVNKLKQVIGSLKGKNILTVSDASNFLQEGGMIRFFTKNNKIQLQINLEATKTANLLISSKLLRLAEIFIPKK
jgi:hypothetical protein